MRPGSCDPLVIVWTIWTLKFRVSFLRYLPTWTENRIPKKGLNQRFGDKRRTEIKSWNQRQSILEKIKVSDGKETKVKFSYFIPLKRTKDSKRLCGSFGYELRLYVFVVVVEIGRDALQN